MEFAEVYSPPRMKKMADMMGMKSGFALDLTTTDENASHGISAYQKEDARR